MAFSSLERLIGAMALMDKAEPYGLKPEDAKRRLAEELARLCREAGAAPLVIGGVAVNHHGYARFTADVALLVSKADAMALVRRFKQEGGWRRYREGFKNTILDVSVDICVEGEPTSPRSAETFPAPADLRAVAVRPLPVPGGTSSPADADHPSRLRSAVGNWSRDQLRPIEMAFTAGAGRPHPSGA